jgi:hypothetical protein
MPAASLLFLAVQDELSVSSRVADDILLNNPGNYDSK